MGIMDFFKEKVTYRKILKEEKNRFTNVVSSANKMYQDFTEQNKISTISAFPRYPHFDDTYTTIEGYKLRELLVLVWFTKAKNGKELDYYTPQYFHYDYNLNIHDVAAKFVTDELLEIRDKKIFASDKGKELSKKYQKLWEIHSSHEQFCLDQEFPKWDEKKHETQTILKSAKDDLSSYKISGVSKYEVLTNKNCCEKCKQFDGLVLSTIQAKIGTNFPPFHEKCRCTTAPWDEWIEKIKKK